MSLESKAITAYQLCHGDCDNASKLCSDCAKEQYVPLEEAQKAVIDEQCHYADAMVERDLVLEKIAAANKILDERENLVITQVDEDGWLYQHKAGLTFTEKLLREALK